MDNDALPSHCGISDEVRKASILERQGTQCTLPIGVECFLCAALSLGGQPPQLVRSFGRVVVAHSDGPLMIEH
jgi:hypothetical protein